MKKAIAIIFILIVIALCIAPIYLCKYSYLWLTLYAINIPVFFKLYNVPKPLPPTDRKLHEILKNNPETALEKDRDCTDLAKIRDGLNLNSVTGKDKAQTINERIDYLMNVRE